MFFSMLFRKLFFEVPDIKFPEYLFLTKMKDVENSSYCLFVLLMISASCVKAMTNAKFMQWKKIVVLAHVSRLYKNGSFKKCLECPDRWVLGIL